MKKIVSFDKELEFNSIIGDINSISLDHTLKFTDSSNINGEFLIKGSYKLSEASRLENNFEFKVPVEVILNEVLDLDSVSIEINDFNYHVDNNDTLVCHIEIKIEGIEKIDEEKEILEEENRECDDDMDEIVEDDIKAVETDSEDESNMESIFSTLNDSDDNFVAYSVYIMRENDSLGSILDKYNITKEELENYNDLDNIGIGSKIVIPYSDE
ncbi:MAG: LysM peptidoglycan-binding domain-containing protein [Bacilli bacterium]|nr:LysM peptidoglycan-binding domain-containing protein [Bacilli bacterium]MBR3049687.1 LysM peptidoglycan-binding domain-containing protein [Bacilli bacterium]